MNDNEITRYTVEVERELVDYDSDNDKCIYNYHARLERDNELITDLDGDSEAEAMGFVIAEGLGEDIRAHRNPSDYELVGEAWATLYDLLEGEDELSDEQLKAIGRLSNFFTKGL